MTRIKTRNLTLDYEVFGAAGDPPLLLIMGLGAQAVFWPDAFCQMLAARGFYVIRFDNRDIGLSDKCDKDGVPDMFALMTQFLAGKKVDSPYTLDDMAQDTVDLLDALGIAKAHIVGASMGGMIAQLLAANHPARVLSLTSIMSTTGHRELPQAKPEALAALMAPAPADLSDIKAVVDRGVATWKAIGSPAYPRDEDDLRAFIHAQALRSYYPQGVARQMAAILADGDRRERLKTIAAPCIVLHGRADPLVPLAGGEDTAAHIKNAELRVIDGMGHDLPEPLFGQIADAICAAAAKV